MPSKYFNYKKKSNPIPKKCDRIDSARIGRSFEELINTICINYKNRGIADIFKEEGLKNHNSHQYRETLHVDFIGTTAYYKQKRYNPALPVRIECKTTTTPDFLIKRIRPNQLDFLHRGYEDGCLSLILLEFIEYNRVIKINYDNNFINFCKQHASLKYTKLEDSGLTYVDYDANYLIDFLEAGTIVAEHRTPCPLLKS